MVDFAPQLFITFLFLFDYFHGRITFRFLNVFPINAGPGCSWPHYIAFSSDASSLGFAVCLFLVLSLFATQAALSN